MTTSLARLILNGTLPNGEGFQCRLTMLNETPTPQSLSYWAAAADRWMGGFLAAGSGMIANYTTNTVFNPPIVQGLAGTPLRVVEQTVGTVGGAGTDASGANPLPSEVAVCVSERGQPAGLPLAGRFYLPPPKVGTLTSTGRLTAAVVGAYAGALESAFTIYVGGDATLRMGIVSDDGARVNTCRRWDVGDVLDSMRSRRNKQVENRVPIHVGYTI